MSDELLTCTLKQVDPADAVSAASTAIAVNPANRPQIERLTSLMPDLEVLPDHLAVVTTKYWGNKGVRLSVQFLDSPPNDVRSRILLNMNEWGRYCNVGFVETASTGQVRIARDRGGYWSYLGTDVLSIRPGLPTMNLEAFTMNTPESEFIRVVRHETGHTLGFPHEHLRAAIVAQLDRNKTIEYFGRTQGWKPQEVVQQVLTPISESSLLSADRTDESSIMCYQIPGECTIDGKPILGGNDISEYDIAYAGKVYPLLVVQPPPPKPGIAYEFFARVYDQKGNLVSEWGWDKDVKVPTNG